MIYIYKGKDFIESLNYNIDEFKSEWYPDWSSDMKTYEKKFENPILDKGELREMTREELVKNGVEIILNVGEVIKNKKLVKIDKPSIYHRWNGKEWFVDLEEVKNNKLEEFKKIRDELCLADLEFQGGKFQVRNSTDLNKFERIILGLIIKVISPEQTEDWRMADNSYKTFTYEELSKIPKIYSDREREIFKKFRELESKLQACNSIDEINSLKWE